MEICLFNERSQNEMQTNDLSSPLSFDLPTYAWVLGLAAWGGLVNYYRKYRCCEIDGFSFVEMFAEISTASFAGVLTFLTCQAAHFTSLFTAVMVGVSGHMGSRSVAFFVHMLQEKVFKAKENDFHKRSQNQFQQYEYNNLNFNKDNQNEPNCRKNY